MRTSSPVISRPDKSEYDPYYERYISLVSGNDVLTLLQTQGQETVDLLSTATETKGDYRYAPDKWSVKELVGHMSDTERILNYRALRISRNDPTPLEGFEQDDYVRNGPFGACRLRDLVDDFANVRQATFHCSGKSVRKPGRVVEQPTKSWSACAHWPSLFSATSYIIGRSCSRSTFSPDREVPHAVPNGPLSGQCPITGIM